MTLNIFISHYFSTPPITRYMFVCIITLLLLVYINAVQPYTLYYSPLFIKYMELWRAFTCFLYFGKPSLDVIIHMTFLYRYSKMLEEGFTYTSDYLYLLFIVWGVLFFLANILSISTLATAFSSTITYIWTRKNPNAMVQMFGFINFPAFYLPFIVPLFMLITEKHILLEDILGILVGHLYYFLKDVYPKFGSDVLKTPCILKILLREHSEDCCRKIKMNKLSIKNKSILNETNITEKGSLINETIMSNKEIFNETIMSNKEISNETTMSNKEISNETTMSNKEISIDDEKNIINLSTKINDVTTIEKNINEYLNNKEEENGWSSQTVSDEESDI